MLWMRKTPQKSYPNIVFHSTQFCYVFHFLSRLISNCGFCLRPKPHPFFHPPSLPQIQLALFVYPQIAQGRIHHPFTGIGMTQKMTGLNVKLLLCFLLLFYLRLEMPYLGFRTKPPLVPLSYD